MHASWHGHSSPARQVQIRRMPTRRRTVAISVGTAFVALVGLLLAAWLVGASRPVRSVPAVVPEPPAAGPSTAVTAVPGRGAVPSTTGSTTAVPTGGTSTGGTSAPEDPTTTWARQTAPRLGMDWRALRSYGRAQLRLSEVVPSCRVTWTTLAGIGWVETRHGTYAGSAVNADGVVRPTITGPALDGTGGRSLVRSTDGGRLDGDTTYDRAVGPMQFIPSTWRAYGSGDPSDFDAAALAAGRFLCATSRATTAGGWRRAVLAYNRSDVYVADVYTAAQWYAANDA